MTDVHDALALAMRVERDADPIASDPVIEDRAWTMIHMLRSKATASHFAERLESRRRGHVREERDRLYGEAIRKDRATLKKAEQEVRVSTPAGTHAARGHMITAKALKNLAKSHPRLMQGPLEAELHEQAVTNVAAARPWLFLSSPAGATGATSAKAAPTSAKKRTRGTPHPSGR